MVHTFAQSPEDLVSVQAKLQPSIISSLTNRLVHHRREVGLPCSFVEHPASLLTLNGVGLWGGVVVHPKHLSFVKVISERTR